MIHIKKIYFILLVLIFSTPALAQRCDDYHKTSDCRIYSSKGFDYYGQSRSALLEIKNQATFKAVFYGDRDYKVVLCTEYGYYPIHFVISNEDTQEILYDNQEDDYIESVGFSIDRTQNLIFEITVLAEDVKPKDSFDLRVCVGVNIYWRKVPQMGF